MIQYPKLGTILCCCIGLATGFLFVGAAEASLWGYRSPTDPIIGEGSLEDLQSDVPPGWVMPRPDPSGQVGPATHDPTVSFDPTQGYIRETYTEGGVETQPPMVADLDAYSNVLTTRTYRRLWRYQTSRSRSIQRGAAKKPQGLFHYDIPIQIPKVFRGILGSGAPNIDVSGSETITLTAASDWTVRREGAVQGERQRPSAFPSLEMKQDLQVNLTGSIGDKIKVDVDQSSNVQTSLDNKVKLRYEGDEDDMIKSIDLGNTNLSLQGASIRQEGLFGVKTVAKLGNVDLVAIASKQEGKTETSRFTPSGEKRQVKIADLEYIKRQYFFISNHEMKWDRTTLRVYRDDRSATNNTQALAGTVLLDPSAPADTTNPRFDVNLDILTPGTDYDLIFPYLASGAQVGAEIPIIKLRYPANPNDILAVTYTEETSPGVSTDIGDVNRDTILVKMIKPSYDGMLRTLAGGAYDPTDPWYPALHYELRNFYDLTARNIARETLTIKVRRRDSGQSVDPDAIDGVPLLQILGLDQQGSTVDTGPDGRMDDRYVYSYEDGIMFFPDLHPFDPGCVPNFLCIDETDRNILARDSLSNPNVYYTKNPDFSSQSRYYVEAEFKSSQAGYFLGRFNILENSEQVKVNGIPQTKGSQYTIDYDTGQLTFNSPPGPDDVISVDYSFAPGVSQVQRTLLGFSTSYSPSADFSVTSSMLYESRGAQELNPKLGEEPARSMIGDLASVMAFRPSWMTRFANLLPGVHTSTQSTLNLQGNLAVSMPNPNTKGEAYVDDMEGNRESNTLALGRPSWLWSSVPVDSAIPRGSVLLHALIQWYNPRSDRGGAKERDLKPVLTNEEGGDNERTVLELNVSGLSDTTATFLAETWAGLTQPLSRTGQDLSRTRFIEIWVNDRKQGVEGHALTAARLHIDFGRVSEDAFWDPRAIPNTVLDTEDKNGDTKLDRNSEDPSADEDTGLDRLHDAEEPGFDGSNDPNGDNYHYETGSTDYSKINGTESNGKDDVNARPDTEDLNLDAHLDVDNDYFEATLNLADTAFVAVDVARDYAGHPSLKPDNGWRLFRIPIDSPAFRSIGRPSWDDVKHARVWLDGMSGPTNIQIGGIELVGSRWLASPLPDAYRARDVIFDVKVRNNKDDAATYTSPFDVPNAVGGNATRREQSLALAYDNLQPGDSVFSFKTYSDVAGAGYTMYRDIRFYLHGDPGVELQNLRMVARFGPDTVNYYEYSTPVRAGWQDIRIPMEVLSLLKEKNTERVKSEPGPDGVLYTVVGNPTFTRVNRIMFGLTVVDPTTPTGPPGEVWIDELRLDGVRKDVGKTGNVVVQANFADVLSFSGNYQKQDQDFFRVGTGVNQGTGLNHTAIGLSSTLQLDRMLPLTGLELPVTVSMAHATDVPKYRTGSDVVLDDARSDLETRRTDRQSIDLRYRRTGPRKGWTRWTVDAISGSMRYAREANVDPQFRDSTWNFGANGSYSLPIGGGKGIPLSKTLRLKYLPEVVTFGMGWSASRRASYSRFIQGLEDSSALRGNTLTRLLVLSTDASYLPINGVTLRYSLNSQRDMLIERDGFLGNVGTEVGHNQTMSLNWVPRRVLFLNPNISLVGTYREEAGQGVRVNQSDPLGLKNISNTGAVRASTAIPLSRFAQKFKPAGAARDTSGGNPITAPLRFVLSRFQDIQTTFTFDRGAAVSRVVGSPGFAYVTGFTQKFNSSSLYRAPNSNVRQSRSYFTTANTTVSPVNRLTINVHADHRIAFNDELLGARRIYTMTWPDLNGSWLQLHQALGMDELLSSLVVSSRYSVRNEDQGPAGKRIETHTRTTSWGPLLRWEASFRNGIRADATTGVSKSEILNQIQGGATRLRITKNHDVRLSKVYPASKGIRFPWSKRRVKLPNDVNLNLTLGIIRDKQETSAPGVETLVETDSQRLTVGSGTTYNFTPSITGGFDLGFTQTKDYKYDLTTRGLRFSLNGQFRF